MPNGIRRVLPHRPPSRTGAIGQAELLFFLVKNCILHQIPFSCHALLPVTLGDEHGAGLTALKGAYDAPFLHLVHQTGGAGIAQLEPPLEHGHRGLSAGHHDVHRLVKDGIIVVVGTAASAATAAFAFVGGTDGLLHMVQDLLIVLGLAALLYKGHDLFHRR